MKKIFTYSLITVFLFSACKKDNENLEVDWNKYPLDTHQPTSALDNWINQNFNQAWNIDVVYRFDRYYTDINRNIAPIELDKVQSSLQMVVDGFTAPYTKLAGKEFGKKLFPKLWVLYGSGSYNSDGTIVLGTMSNARMLNLYDLNNLSPTNSASIRRRLRTVHHEFMHSLNQTVPIPPAYQTISGQFYDPTWAGKSDAQVRPLGFISPYASSAYTEDFAEMLSHIVVEGPVWYNNYLLLADADGYARLKAKEAMVYSYMLTNFNIDMYELQAEVQKQLKTIYGATDPVDISTGFAYRLAGNKVNTITYDPTAAHYTTYGSSTAFNTVYNNYKAALQTNNWYLKSIQFIFTSATTMTLRTAFTQGATGTTVYNGDYNFNYSINSTNGLVVFTKALPEGTGTTYSNGQIATVLTPFEQNLLPYLTGRQFIASYLPSTLEADNPLYRTFAGFSVSGTPTNYFYGPVTYK